MQRAKNQQVKWKMFSVNCKDWGKWSRVPNIIMCAFDNREDNKRMREELAKIQSNISQETRNTISSLPTTQYSPRTRPRSIIRETEGSYRQEEPARRTSPRRTEPQRSEVKAVTPNRSPQRSPRNRLDRSFEHRKSPRHSPAKLDRPSTQESFYPSRVARSRDERDSSAHHSVSRGGQRNNPKQKTEEIS